MKRWIAAAVAVLLAGVVAWIATRPEAPGQPPQAGAAAPASAAPSDLDVAALEATPQARQWRQRRDFARRLKTFLAAAPGMGAVARSEQARALAAAVDAQERARRMSAGEAFLLQAALIDAGAVDEDARVEALARLAERYRADAARREQAWRTQLRNDPRFRDYKASERRIVAEVMAMPEIPGGLSRDAYLRQRLLQARERAYGP